MVAGILVSVLSAAACTHTTVGTMDLSSDPGGRVGGRKEHANAELVIAATIAGRAGRAGRAHVRWGRRLIA